MDGSNENFPSFRLQIMALKSYKFNWAILICLSSNPENNYTFWNRKAFYDVDWSTEHFVWEIQKIGNVSLDIK